MIIKDKKELQENAEKNALWGTAVTTFKYNRLSNWNNRKFGRWGTTLSHGAHLPLLF